jgi:hypothetical protein
MVPTMAFEIPPVAVGSISVGVDGKRGEELPVDLTDSLVEQLVHQDATSGTAAMSQRHGTEGDHR